MQRHLYVVPRPKGSRPAKVVQLEVRRQLRREAERPEPRRAGPSGGLIR